MSSIFKKQQDYVQKPNRNNFDLSFNNNFTTKFGQLTPVLCKEVNPGDRFRINASLGIRALPLAFPIQTPVQAHMAFFYCRNRTVWKNWMDFYGRTKDNLIHPYISIPYTRAGEIGTGTLADFLGVPTTYAQSNQTDWFSYDVQGLNRQVYNPNSSTSEITGLVIETPGENPEFSFNLNQSVNSSDVSNLQYRVTPLHFDFNTTYYSNSEFSNVAISNLITYNTVPSSVYAGYGVHTPKLKGSLSGVFRHIMIPDVVPGLPNPDCHVIISTEDISNPGYDNSKLLPYLFSYSVIDDGNGNIQGTITNHADYLSSSEFEQAIFNGYYVTFLTDSGGNADDTLLFGHRVLVSQHLNVVSDVSNTSNPFVIQDGDSFPDIKLNALPFRMYEQIYNCYYRNEINDPFILNGQPEYNRYITNDADGADSTTPLYLRFRNYELDFLTSAVNSPQQGVAPLVGVSSTGVFTFEDENGNTFTVTPKIGDDGNTLTGIDSYDPDIPQGSLFHLKDMIKYGISINDFRNVNSLQRWLETNIRRGFKYKDQILSHFGVNVRYDELDMPEYIGGFTRNLTVQQINASAETSEMKLGDYAGQMGLFANSKHSINHYCDEPGFIIGILCIVPIPNYSQLLSKHFLKDNVLSYHFPEFNHIGYQPIDYREVTPIQAKLYGKDYNDTFGYQRPYYDLIASVDENHGLFRTELQDFLISRNFGQPPLLSHDFLAINPDDMTNPFVETTENKDTFMGQIFFDIKAKRSVSKIHIPRLE